MNFKDKTVVVTGASRGLGKAIAKAFGEKKSNLALIARNPETLDYLAEELQTSENKVQAYPLDIQDPKAIEETFKTIRNHFGSLDVLINNAGITKDNLILRMSETDWDKVMDTNLKGTFLCSKMASKIMVKQRFGSIINISSVIGLVGNAGQSNYSASKAGMIGFTKSLARELGSRNIRINAIAPGFIETHMTQNITEDMADKMKANIPLRRMGQPKEIASICLFLASSYASYITGSVIQADGGLFA